MANRERKKMSHEFFSWISDSVLKQGDAVQNSDKPRYIPCTDANDQELMARADAISLVVTRQIRLVRISWEDSFYFCIFGLEEPEVLPAGLVPIVLTPGVFTLSVLTAKVPPSATALAIREVVESGHLGEAGYVGHGLDSVVALFPPVTVYRGSNAYEYQKYDHRVLGSILATSFLDNEGPIQFEVDTINSLKEILEGGDEHIPYRNLVQGLLSISWENLFLETYRCIEQLYAQPRVLALREVWSSDLPLRDLAALLEDHLSWRPKEEEALLGLIQVCDQPIISTACTTFGIATEERATDNINAAIARRIYKLRNSVVHYRPAHEPINETDKSWNEIICLMLAIIRHLYAQYGVAFFEARPLPS